MRETTPKFGWEEVQVTKLVEVPNMVQKQVQGDTRVWYEKVARYKTVRVDEGGWAYRTATRYRSERYVRY